MDRMKQDELYAMRHSLAHIMATAIQHLWPEVKFGVGPVTENGFYYDIDLGDKKLSEEDFATLETEMRKVIQANQPFEKFEKPVDEAIAWAEQAGQPYKQELLNDLKRAGTTVAKDLNAAELGTIAEGDSQVTAVSFYKNGDFTDLCRGPHVQSTGSVGFFKLMRVSGAYWRGKETNPQMQRVYGVAFASQEALDQHLKMLEEAKARDHRKLGQELDLFVFSDLVGQGLPLWTPRGTTLRRELNNFVQELREEYDFQEVAIPHITKKDLYEKSGHWVKFADELFKINTREGREFAMKPMNCPHHTQIYASRPRSYRELPIRYRETTMVYRDEQTGELGGLSRVRSITQDDAHVFCRRTQIKEEVDKLWNIIERFYAPLDIPLRLRLSINDPDKPEAYLGDPGTWENIVNELKAIADVRGVEYELGVGEAAFYGPKLDFMGRDAIGREHQVATIQLDFNQPEGFDLTCINEHGEPERIIMIHCAVMGSIERFLSILIEHTAGKFPVWLAPEQVRLLTVASDEKMTAYADKMAAEAKGLGLRATVDDSKETLGKKIRAAEVDKVPYVIVIGQKEVEGDKLIPRVRKDIEVQTEHSPVGSRQFLQTVHNEARARINKSSL
jgi:threonyl-tRNA synthetase